MAEAGVLFLAGVPCVAGSGEFLLAPNEVSAFIADNLQFAAASHGVSKVQYLEWLENNGKARCGAKTAKGHRCRNYLSGPTILSITEWLNRDGGYCAVHGGETAEEARIVAYE